MLWKRRRKDGGKQTLDSCGKGSESKRRTIISLQNQAASKQYTVFVFQHCILIITMLSLSFYAFSQVCKQKAHPHAWSLQSSNPFEKNMEGWFPNRRNRHLSLIQKYPIQPTYTGRFNFRPLPFLFLCVVLWFPSKKKKHDAHQSLSVHRHLLVLALWRPHRTR